MKKKIEPTVCSKCELSFLRRKQFRYHCKHSHGLMTRIECGTHFHYSEMANLICNGKYATYINELKVKANIESLEPAITQ